jgi:hypothetical protein
VRILAVISFFLLGNGAFSQTAHLKQAVTRLDAALVKKDTAALKQLLHRDLSYGHSNAWVERKSDVINNLLAGKIAYNKIETKNSRWTLSGGQAILRTEAEIKYILDGKSGELHLHVLQVWVKTNGRWQLFARQSTKI